MASTDSRHCGGVAAEGVPFGTIEFVLCFLFGIDQAVMTTSIGATTSRASHAFKLRIYRPFFFLRVTNSDFCYHSQFGTVQSLQLRPVLNYWP